MSYQLDITGNQFDFVDFSEASAYVNLIPKLGHQIELHFWGITLLTSQVWGEPLRLSGIEHNANDDIYIAGYAMVIFHEVIGGELKVTLYDPDSSEYFLKNHNNQPVILQKRWGFKSANFLYELYFIHSDYRYWATTRVAPYGRVVVGATLVVAPLKNPKT